MLEVTKHTEKIWIVTYERYYVIDTCIYKDEKTLRKDLYSYYSGDKKNVEELTLKDFVSMILDDSTLRKGEYEDDEFVIEVVQIN